MIMGPEPMRRIVRRSVRFGMDETLGRARPIFRRGLRSFPGFHPSYGRARSFQVPGGDNAAKRLFAARSEAERPAQSPRQSREAVLRYLAPFSAIGNDFQAVSAIRRASHCVAPRVNSWRCRIAYDQLASRSNPHPDIHWSAAICANCQDYLNHANALDSNASNGHFARPTSP